MALKATVFRAEVTIADMDRELYGDHTLTLARHPSETDERMMVRLLAFVLNAEDGLAFGAGLSSEDEPALLTKAADGSLDHWIEVGLPDPKRLRQGATRSRRLTVYTYGGSKADLWWQRNHVELGRIPRPVRVVELALEETTALAALADRGMRLTATVQDGQVWITDRQDRMVGVTPRVLDPASWTSDQAQGN
ncbi:MAG TPA: YaeQ family protein [Pseudomonadales bacterium]|nr:YaeQ family protein [Pseudomonadales bacterium]